MASTLSSIGDLWFGLSKKGRIAVVAGVAGALVVGLVAYGVYNRVVISQEQQVAAEQQAAQEAQQAEEEAQRQEQESTSSASDSEKNPAEVELFELEQHAEGGLPIDKLPAVCKDVALNFEADLKRLVDEKYQGKGVERAQLDTARSLTAKDGVTSFAAYLVDGSGSQVARLRFDYDEAAKSFKMTAAYELSSADPDAVSAAREASKSKSESTSASSEPERSTVRRDEGTSSSSSQDERRNEGSSSASSGSTASDEPDRSGSSSSSGSSEGGAGSASSGGSSAQEGDPGTGGVQGGTETGGSEGSSRPTLPDASPDGSWTTGGNGGSALPGPSGDGHWSTGGGSGSGSWTTGRWATGGSGGSHGSWATRG